MPARQRPTHLGDEKGVAAGEDMHVLHVDVRHFTADHRDQLTADCGSGETVQLDAWSPASVGGP